MTIACRFKVDVFEVVVVFDDDLNVRDLQCNCDSTEDWCRHSTPSWTMLVHSLRVAEGHETPGDLPDHRDDLRLVQADPEKVERVWRRRFTTTTMAHSFLLPPGRDE